MMRKVRRTPRKSSKGNWRRLIKCFHGLAPGSPLEKQGTRRREKRRDPINTFRSYSSNSWSDSSLVNSFHLCLNINVLYVKSETCNIYTHLYPSTKVDLVAGL